MNIERASAISGLIAERKLQTHGFARTLRTLVRTFAAGQIPIDDADDPDSVFGPSLDNDSRDEADGMFEEWFGDLHVVPAAFKIEHDAKSSTFHVWDFTIHIYEIVRSGFVPDHKLIQYGWMADGEGPNVVLHVIDRFGHEKTISCDHLMTLAFLRHYKGAAKERLLCEAVTDGAYVPPPLPARPPPPPTTSIYTRKQNERAILRALYDMNIIAPEDLK